MKRITRSRDWDEAKLCWGRLDTIENILGDEYDLDHLKELVEVDRQRERWIEGAKSEFGKAARKYALEVDGWWLRELVKNNKTNIERIRDLVEADREGRLFETPFKIGTHIFNINDGNIGEWEVIGFSFGVPYLRVFGSHNYRNEVFVIAKEITVDGRIRFQFTLSEIGEKVFLSQKEAEAALEKMKEGNK